MNIKDYYQILGVPKTATTAEIKKAYRKLALKFHPDKNKGNKAAAETFNDLNDANQVLSDPDKRKKYDTFGAEYKQYEERGPQQQGFDWNKYRPAQSQNDRDFGTQFDGDESDIFEFLFGRQGGPRQRKSPAISGEDLKTETTLTLDEAYHGTTRTIQLEGQKIRVTIPPGIAHLHVLRIVGKGMPGYNNGSNGDLYLTIKIAPHQEFHRKGNDLFCSCQVKLYTAVLGGKALVKTLKGAVKVTIPKETQNGTELRLHGQGMPLFGQKNDFGDVFVKLDIQIPDHLSAQEIDLFSTLASLRT